MNITIVGAGNIGTQFALHCADKKHNVIIFTKRFKEISKKLTISDKENNIIKSAEINFATDNPELAFKNADLIFVTVPAFLMKQSAEIIKKYVKSNTLIGIIPGLGGGELAFSIVKNCVIFGLQRLPSVARLVEYGKNVCVEGYRNELFVASIPIDKADYCAKIMAGIFDMKCSPLPNFLNLTLTPSNSILHTSRLYSLFKDWHDEKVYDYIPLFYEEWDNKSSELLLKCDEEVQNICKSLKDFDLSGVKSLKEHYESYTIEDLTKKITSIKGFKGLTTPSVKYKKGYIPDFNSRYFKADFPYSLALIKQIADLIKSPPPTENINLLLNWYVKFKGTAEIFNISDYGINNINDLKNFYLR